MLISLASYYTPKATGVSIHEQIRLANFGAGEQGAMYTPIPSIDGQQILYQDANMTVPVTTDSQPVRAIRDFSGNGNHATAPSDAARPLYRTDGTLHWLQFDGTDDALVGGSFLVDYNWIMVAGLAIDSRGGIGDRIWSTTPSNTDKNALGFFARTDVVEDFVAALRVGFGDNIKPQVRGDYSIGQPFVGTGWHETNSFSAQVNQLTPDVEATTPVAGTDYLPLALSGVDLQHKFYGGVFVKTLMSAADRADLQSYIADRAGVTL